MLVEFFKKQISASIFGLFLLTVIILTKYYYRVRSLNFKSGEMLLYLVFLTSLNQILRDGLISVITFPFIIFFPLTFMAYFSIIFGKKINNEANQ